MFSKSQIKLINSLKQKKYRQKHGLFVVEGKKVISELLDSSLNLQAIYTTEDIFNADPGKVEIIKEADLKKISRLATPQTALALFEIPETKEPELKGLTLALDDLQDPGNLGTIIRMCDWFDIKNLICSDNTADCYNAKVVQATMGSIARVNIYYTNLPEYLEKASTVQPVYGAFLEGENVYREELPSEGILVMGNEANGISENVASKISKKLLIPRFGDHPKTESLNVATATAILLSEFGRRLFIEK
jgi:RNA methyltransferase, TrmH family